VAHYNPKWRTYKGQRHWGDYQEFQNWKYSVDIQIQLERQQRQEEYEAEKQRQREERYAERRRIKDQVIADQRAADSYFNSNIRQYYGTHRNSPVQQEIDRQKANYAAERQSCWSNQDASGLYRYAQNCIGILDRVWAEYQEQLNAEELRERQKKEQERRLNQYSQIQEQSTRDEFYPGMPTQSEGIDPVTKGLVVVAGIIGVIIKRVRGDK
jgi:hypothetical protein